MRRPDRPTGEQRLERARHGLDRFHPRAEPRHGMTVRLQLAVREESYAEVSDPAERGPCELRPHVRFSVVRRDEKEAMRTVARRAEGKVEHADDAAVDARR